MLPMKVVILAENSDLTKKGGLCSGPVSNDVVATLHQFNGQIDSPNLDTR